MKHLMQAAFVIASLGLMIASSARFVVAQPATPRNCLGITPEIQFVEKSVFYPLDLETFVRSLGWSPDGQWIGASYLDMPINHSERLYIWDIATGEPQLAFARLDQGYALWPSNYSWSPDSTRLALNSNAIFSIVTLETGEQIMPNNGEPISGRYVWSWDSSQVATLEPENIIRIWDAATGQQTRSIDSNGPMRNYQGVWPEQGLRWLTQDENGINAVWEENSSEPIFTIGPDVGSVSLSPSGRFLVTLGPSAIGVRIWDVSTRDLLQTLSSDAPINRVLWSQDERCVLTATRDLTTAWMMNPQIWDVTSGNLLQTIDGRFEDWDTYAFSPDGTGVAYIDTDGAIHVWGLE
jgi:WD40 repeat protein